MADQIQYQGKTWEHGLFIYALIRNSSGQVFRTDAQVFENYVTANLTKYAVALTEQGTASAFFLAAFPNLAAGEYFITAYRQVGAAAVEGDDLVGDNPVYWTGGGFRATRRPPASSGTVVVTGPVTAMIHEGVDAFLLASARIPPLAGKSIFPDFAPKGASYPRLVWFRVDTTRQKTLRKTVKLPMARFQIEAWGLTRATAAKLLNAVRQDVQDWYDAGLNAMWGPINVRSVVIENEMDNSDPPHDSSDVHAFRSQLDLVIWYRE